MTVRTFTSLNPYRASTLVISVFSVPDFDRPLWCPAAFSLENFYITNARSCRQSIAGACGRLRRRGENQPDVPDNADRQATVELSVAISRVLTPDLTRSSHYTRYDARQVRAETLAYWL
jgi:hypothetical protein